MNNQLNGLCQLVEKALGIDGIVYNPKSSKLKEEKELLMGNIIGLALLGKFKKEDAQIISVHTSEAGINKLLDIRTEQAVYILEAEKIGLPLKEILRDYEKVRV